MLRKAETSTSLIERRFDLMQILTCLLFNTALTIQVEDSSDTKRQYYRIWILASFIRISVSCFVCLFVFFSWLILQWSLTQGMPLLASFINYCQCCASLCLLILQMLIFFFFFTLFLVIPECFQYKSLNGFDRRKDYDKYSRSGKKCDKDLTEDWYRFYGGAGTVMASSCVPTHRCNTDLTGWMEGSPPTVDEGVVRRKVCFHGYGSCCYKNVEINVRNCGPFYVYRLKKPTVCSSRYCGSN